MLRKRISEALKNPAMYWVLFGITLVASFAGLPWVVNNHSAYKEDVGQRKIGVVWSYHDPKMTISTIEFFLDRTDTSVVLETGRMISKVDPERPSDYAEMNELVEDMQLMYKKSLLESRKSDYYLIYFYKDEERLPNALSAFLADYKQLCVEKFGKSRVEQGIREHERDKAPYKEYTDKYMLPSYMPVWKSMAEAGLWYLFCWLVFFTWRLRWVEKFSLKQIVNDWIDPRRMFLSSLLGPIMGARTNKRQPIEQIKFLVKLVAMTTWAAVKVATVAMTAVMKIAAARTQAFAYGLATMLACMVSVGAAQSQQSTESGKRKADIVIIEEAAKQKTAVVNAKPKNLAWDITLDVKPSENIGSGLVFPTRLTVLYKRLVIENVFFSSTTPTVRQIGNDITPGYSVIKNLHLTVNIVGGINNTTATQIATNKVTRTNKILMGGQIFGKIKRFSFGSPVARFEKIMNGKVLPALVEFFYVDTTPKIKLGHEGFFTKTAQGGFIYNLAVLLQWKPAIAGPAMEIGIFSNHLRMPNGQIVRSLGIRGRGIFKWRF
jgi:hypothetical protein